MKIYYIMENEYVFNMEEQQLWGSNKLPVCELNVEDMFNNMNEDLFRELADGSPINESVSINADKLQIMNPRKRAVYGRCSLGVGCTKPATHLWAANITKSLRGVKIFSCEKHVSFNMVPLDKWLCKASQAENPEYKCTNKARCYIEYRQGPLYCFRHAKKIWSNRIYFVE